jgi:hypothetical protein
VLRVLVPPDPIVLPSDLSGGYGDGDASVAAVINAVTAAIDGPAGWLGRALGEQTIELSGPGFHHMDRDCEGIRLPCPPTIEIEAVTHLDSTGAEQVVDEAAYYIAGNRLWPTPGSAWPSTGRYANAARIRYRAGYNGTPPDQDGGTGDVPENARQAIIVSAQHLINTGAENLFVSLDLVEGIGERRFVVSDQASKLIESVCDSLLGPLKVWA